MADQRLQRVYNAASQLFINQGYARTQVGDIARRAEVSVGAVYALFAGKKNIFQFLLRCVLEPDYIESVMWLPLNDDCFAQLEAEVAAAFAASADAFEKPLHGGAAFSYEGMLSAAFDMVQRTGTGLLLIEKNQFDFPRLAGQYRQYRGRFFSAMEQYMAQFEKSGRLRQLQNRGLCVRVIVENIAYWAMHVRHDAFETDVNLTYEAAKNACMDAMIHAYRA